MSFESQMDLAENFIAHFSLASFSFCLKSDPKIKSRCRFVHKLKSDLHSSHTATPTHSHNQKIELNCPRSICYCPATNRSLLLSVLLF
jgi:hypothetical protein